jgi:Domain of Unknown Function (DUF1080)
MSFDPYRKWLGIPANKRTPNFYDVLGIAEGENDIDVIRNAIQQRRAFVQSKRGEGHDDSVKVLLRLFEEAAATLLVPEFKTRYDQQLGLYLKRKRTGNRRSYILPSWMESRIVRVYGEGSGIVGDLFAIVAILFCAFALMAYLSFGLQTKASKNNAASEPTWLERMVLGVSGDNSSLAEGQPDSSVSSENPIQFQVDELRSKVTKWQESQEKLKRLIESLETDRKTILGKLDQFTRNKSNAENSPEAKVLATELNEILGQSDACRSKLKDYELAILKSESKLRSIERQLAVSEAGVSEEELKELAATVMELDESLSDQDTVSAITATLDNRTTKMLDEFRGEHKKTEPSTSEDRVADVPAAQQADDVRKKLMELNPGFDGKMDTKIDSQSNVTNRQAGHEESNSIIGLWQSTYGTESKSFSSDGTFVEMNKAGKVFNSGNWQKQDGRNFQGRLKNGSSIAIQMIDSTQLKFTVFNAKNDFVEAKRMLRDNSGTSNGSITKPILLLEGNDLRHWESGVNGGGISNWKIDNGVLKLAREGQSIKTKDVFRDFDLHLEFKLPAKNNTGVFLRGRYEVQLLDSLHRNQKGEKAPPVGQCGAIWGQYAPSKDVYKGPNQWNTLDVRLVGDRVTVRMNNVMIIDNKILSKVTDGALDKNESDPGPILLQAHATIGQEFRNISITPIQFRKIEMEEDNQAVVTNPFQRNSIWSDGGLTLTVIDQENGTFRAKLETSGWARIIKGTIKDGKVTWLAKDDQPNKGSAGSDNYGTISQDVAGYKMYVDWRQSNGKTGNFTLRLNP